MDTYTVIFERPKSEEITPENSDELNEERFPSQAEMVAFVDGLTWGDEPAFVVVRIVKVDRADLPFEVHFIRREYVEVEA